ncbi:macro domain-containing protein [Sedimentibacter sp. MB31-C6]|uniref:macro domain-containing protein n=1 Tax=Sedimentibacter sp. MB31-C6 TaxID=3109366 RepID=UPI002DDCD6FE|nr:macro domain-containing protein [Sedimentibacter sp. MB36-C1]WSI04816.1 macro domain-containing protein [Sedimentibacter sp. MB36-C1]
MPFEIIRNDITKMNVDAIVNAANTALKMGGGVCGAIFNAAGYEALQIECDAIGGCKVGEAVITKGYNLPAKYIIHTVGPIWNGGNNNEEKHLINCYMNSLKLAQGNNIKSIAFPLISSGIYGYPKQKALKVALSSIERFLLENEMMVYLSVFDKKALELTEKLFESIEKYINDKYIEENYVKDRDRIIENYEIQEEQLNYKGFFQYIPKHSIKGKRKLEDVVKNLDETFSQMLLRLIDEKGKTDVETYKKANIDRKLFSKIRVDKHYKPRKTTALALAISLELNLDETKDLICKAGYALSHSSKFDIIVEYFIEEGNYNIFEINEALFAFDQSLLGV